MKYYATIMNDAEEAYSLTWKDVYNIVHSVKRQVTKLCS